uniref:Uncharacterized protein n=1 Tax=Chenopodium quinoa TaxID=63459 RepID=A0A803MA98_CHEQI
MSVILSSRHCNFLKDLSEDTIKHCCVVAHLLASENLRLLAQDVISWVILRIGPCRNVVKRMRDVGVVPSLSAISILFKLLFRVGDYDASLPDLSVSGLCWANQLDEAMKLLEDLIERGLPIGVIAFNSIIAAYAKVVLEEEAFRVYKIMVQFGLSPTSSTCSSLLVGLSNKGRLQEGKELINHMIANGFPVNKVSFTALLDGYCQIGDMSGAQTLWNEMSQRGLSPDAVPFSAYIDGLSRAGLVEEAFAVFTEMKMRGYMPNNFAYNSLIFGLCNSGIMDEALKLEREMKQMGLVPDNCTFNIIINGFCKQGRMKSAIDAFAEMHRIGLSPDIVTYNTLINGYCKAFDLASANDILHKMHFSGWSPDITTYNIHMHGLCSSRRVNQAIAMLDELVSSGIVSNSITYNIMMNGVCGDILDRAMMLAAKLLKVAFIPNVGTINLLLSQFYKQGIPQKTLMWAQMFHEIGFEFDNVTYKILDKAYSDLQEDMEASAADYFCMQMMSNFLQQCKLHAATAGVQKIETLALLVLWQCHGLQLHNFGTYTAHYYHADVPGCTNKLRSMMDYGLEGEMTLLCCALMYGVLLLISLGLVFCALQKCRGGNLYLTPDCTSQLNEGTLDLIPPTVSLYSWKLEQDVETVIRVLQPGPVGIVEHKFTDKEIHDANAMFKNAVKNWQRRALLEKSGVVKDYVEF